MTIDLKFLKRGVNLKKLTAELNKLVKSQKKINSGFDTLLNNDGILGALTDSYPISYHPDGDPFDLGEEIHMSGDDSFKNFLLKKSRMGELLSLISDNFKFVQKVNLTLEKKEMCIYLTCTFSKINKMYYLEFYQDYRRDCGDTIIFKTKKKHLALKEMKKIITNTKQDMRSVTLN